MDQRYQYSDALLVLVRHWCALVALIGMAALTVPAQATSCLVLPELNPMAADFDRDRVIDQAKWDLATFGLVAEATLLQMEPGAFRPDLRALKIARVQIEHYYRQPLAADGTFLEPSVYFVVLSGGQDWPPGESRLLFASPESDAMMQHRLNQNSDGLTLVDALPSHIRDRLWLAESPCRELVMAPSPSADAIRSALQEITQNTGRTGTLVLQVQEQWGDYVPGSGRGVLGARIEGLDTTFRRTIQVNLPEGLTLELPVGRYRVSWDDVNAARSWCVSSMDTQCVVSIAAGLTQRLIRLFEGTAHADVQVLDATLKPVVLLPILELKPLDPSAPGQPSKTSFEIEQHWPQNVAATHISERPRYRVRPGRYAVRLRTGSAEALCSERDVIEYPLAVRLYSGRAKVPRGTPLRSEPLADNLLLTEGIHRIDVPLAENQVPLYRLSLRRGNPAISAVVTSRCLNRSWMPSWQNDRAEALMLAGQHVQVNCQGCRDATVRTFQVTGDVELVLE
ncbi:hypothetical protein C7S18_10385 [Ahniella affigens]|uniref:Uncharacterized protein n=1 Tax=Ahniella affigens TaxID=2021234 RepID=A0A2P1PRW6_9GAMM|nr:hypothetical protein [Ahniella affigens]AVP97578.1 hypothetical protein C7S18_10385 [Ahniella affigens]